MLSVIKSGQTPRQQIADAFLSQLLPSEQKQHPSSTERANRKHTARAEATWRLECDRGPDRTVHRL